MLAQNRATDAWNFFQAKSTKKNLYAIAADQGGPKAAAYAQEVAKNDGRPGQDPEAGASGFEAARDAAGERAEVHERRHGRLTIASTLLHMAIAIATLSIILHRRWPWIIALLLTAGGLGLALYAYI